MLNFVRNLTIGKKLYSGFSFILVILIALSLLSYSNFSKLNQASEWNDHSYKVLLEFEQMLGEMVNMETGQRGFLLTGDEKTLEPYTSGKTHFDEHFAATKELTSDNPKQQQLLDQLIAQKQQWQAIADASIELRRDVVAGTASMDAVIRDEQEAKGKAAFDQFRSIVAESEAIERELLAERAAENENRRLLTNASLMGGTIVAVVLGLLIAFFISRLITRPIDEVNHAAKQMAAGNLDIDIAVKSRDEVGQLAEAFLDMAEHMNEVLTNINESAEQVSSGARQVSDSSMVLSQGATEQASSIEELSASLEEIGSQTNMNAERAMDANQLAISAKSQAIEGDEQMRLMLRSMDEINESSSNISKIIKVIDEIAFQTNILALNAAVEAARAGQHGKGFAVVAEEVRNLAARSASAAKETTDLIEGSIKKVEGGTRIANETAGALNEIVKGVTKVAELVDQIASASNEQASAIGQINQAVMQVSQVTQTNSATSEESASASEQLSSQAELLKQQVHRFRLKSVSAGAYQASEQLSPEISQMLHRLSNNDRGVDGKATSSASSKKRIILSDQEFGKY